VPTPFRQYEEPSDYIELPLKTNEESASTIQIPKQKIFSVDNLNRIMTQIQARGDLNGL
jgi:hypothetical protein